MNEKADGVVEVGGGNGCRGHVEAGQLPLQRKVGNAQADGARSGH